MPTLPPEDPKGAKRRQLADYERKHAKEIALSNAVKIHLVKGITAFKDKLDPAELIRAIRTKQYHRIQRVIPWHNLVPELQKTGEPLYKAAVAASRSAAIEVAHPDGLKYSLKNPRFADHIEHKTGQLITRVQDGTMTAVRASVEKAFTHGWTPKDVANNIRGSIGLNARQATALTNYRASLSTPEKGLSTSHIDKLSTAYENRLLSQRAILIARTEVRGAQNAAQQEVWEQAHRDGLIDHTAKREWVVDGNPCPEICAPMDGEQVGLYEPWVLPDGRRVFEPSSAHPNCYCVASLVT